MTYSKGKHIQPIQYNIKKVYYSYPKHLKHRLTILPSFLPILEYHSRVTTLASHT